MIAHFWLGKNRIACFAVKSRKNWLWNCVSYCFQDHRTYQNLRDFDRISRLPITGWKIHSMAYRLLAYRCFVIMIRTYRCFHRSAVQRNKLTPPATHCKFHKQSSPGESTRFLHTLVPQLQRIPYGSRPCIAGRCRFPVEYPGHSHGPGSDRYVSPQIPGRSWCLTRQ